jgi:hypothetical protein
MPDSDRLAALALDAHVRIVDSRMVVSTHYTTIYTVLLVLDIVIVSASSASDSELTREVS